MWAAYSRLLYKYPLTVKSVSTGILMGSGDALSQYLEHRVGGSQEGLTRDTYDWPRTARMAVFGAVASGPGMHYWYNWLEGRIAATGTTLVAKQVLADQVVFSPLIVTGFFVMDEMLQGRGVAGAKQSLEHNWLDAMKMNYVMWPAAMAVCFKLVPTHHRVMYVNIVQVLWAAVLSTINARDSETVLETESDQEEHKQQHHDHQLTAEQKLLS